MTDDQPTTGEYPPFETKTVPGGYVSAGVPSNPDYVYAPPPAAEPVVDSEPDEAGASDDGEAGAEEVPAAKPARKRRTTNG